MNKAFCQSCGMPMEDHSLWGTNEDGSPNGEYCTYCYQKGAFLADCTMEQMAEACVAPMVQAHPELTAQAAREMMLKVLPTLKRWAHPHR